MNSMQYFNYEDEMTFIPSKGNLSEFLVFSHEACEVPKNGQMTNNKVKVARVQIGRVKDWTNFEVKTHLGDILKEGSYAMGYDLSSLCFSGFVDDNNIFKHLPDIILIKKAFPEAKNLKKRIWRLKQLEKEEADTKAMNKGNQAKDYEEFLDDLETDPELRGQINLYRNEKTLKDKDRMDDENATEDTSGKKSKKQHKKKLKVKKGKKKAQGNATAAPAGGEGEGDEAKDPEENKDEIQDEDEEETAGERDENDPMVKVEELLADLTLEEHGEVEDNGDAIDEFIRRLEKVKIEGKEKE